MSQPEGLRVTLLQGRPQRTRDHFRMGGKSSAQTLRVFSLSLNTSLPITPLVRPCASRCAWNIVDRKTISGLVFYRHSATGHVQWKRPLGTSEAAFALSPIRTADASRATFLSPTSHTFSKTPSPPTAATSPAHGHTDGGPGCCDIASKRMGRMAPHTVACRKRMENAVRASDPDR